MGVIKDFFLDMLNTLFHRSRAVELIGETVEKSATNSVLETGNEFKNTLREYVFEDALRSSRVETIVCEGDGLGIQNGTNSYV